MMQVFQDQYNLCSIEPGMRLTVKKAQNTVIITRKLSQTSILHLTGGGTRFIRAASESFYTSILCYLLSGNLGSL